MKDWLIIICFLLILVSSLVCSDLFYSCFEKASQIDKEKGFPNSNIMQKYDILQDIALRVADAALFSALLYLSLMVMKLLSDKQLKTKYFLINLFVILLFPFCNALLHILVQYTREYFGKY
jgi:hypothetical protein